MNVFDFLFVEACRVCHKLIAPKASPVKTLCSECWGPLAIQEAQLDSCPVPNFGPITVAHAAAYEATMKILIYKLKYDSDRLIAKDLGLLLSKACAALRERSETTATLVPIPLSNWRMLKRGFNQAEMLAQEVSRKEDLILSTKFLRRRKHTKAQHKLNKLERTLNLQNAFNCIGSKSVLQNTEIILVDDIHTSGATLSEAAHSLLTAGAKSVSAITVARAI